MDFDQPLIAKNITLFRGDKCVLTNISLDLTPGELCIVRGTNGAGKSSLLACLANLTPPDMGEVQTCPPFHWLGHKNGVKARETPRQHIQTWGRALGATHKTERQCLTDWGLESFCDLPSKHLSQGQKRRTALARLGLAHRALWLLDEPFSALDSAGQAVVIEHIAGHRKRGGIVIAALHGNYGLDPSQEITL